MKDSKVWKYPAGEIGLRLNTNQEAVPEFLIRSSDDLMTCCLYLNAKFFNSTPVRTIYLPYMPYSRQDRVVTPGDPVPLQLLTHMFKACGVRAIITDDIHSQTAIDWFEGLGITITNRYPKEAFDTVMNNYKSYYGAENIVLVAPDKGSKDRVKALNEAHKLPILYLDKIRNKESGKIEKITYHANYNNEFPSAFHKAKLFLIVDDICDGGGTFVELGKMLKTDFPNADLGLFVTHGIFSNGFEELNNYYSHINWKNRL